MQAFLTRRWFLISLAAVMGVGVSGWSHLLPLLSYPALRYGVVSGVLFLMALPLEARAMGRTIRRPGAPLLGVAMNSLALPLGTWFFVAVVAERLLTHDLALGLLVAAATPSTLASAAVWTRRAGGNDAISIMVTMITNATCFVVTPFWLLRTTGTSVDLDSVEMMVTLASFVVLPMAVAQLLRLVRPVGRWATHHKIPLGVVAQLGVLMMIFFGSIQTGQRLATLDGRPTWTQLVTLVCSVITIHVAALAAGMAIARSMGMRRGDQIAVGFAGSQKTLMVGLQVSMELGINILPMVAYHISQLLVDTWIADRLRRRNRDGE